MRLDSVPLAPLRRGAGKTSRRARGLALDREILLRHCLAGSRYGADARHSDRLASAECGVWNAEWGPLFDRTFRTPHSALRTLVCPVASCSTATRRAADLRFA